VFTGGVEVFTGGALGGGGIEVLTGGGADAGGGGADDCANARPVPSSEASETQSKVVFMVVSSVMHGVVRHILSG
jgi:hypothetical protein